MFDSLSDRLGGVFDKLRGRGALTDDWKDPEGIVSHRRWVSREEMTALQVKPDSLAHVAWDAPESTFYDLLEPIVR